MLPAFQPSRPKPSQQPTRPTYIHQQQRAIHETPHPTPSSSSNEARKPNSNLSNFKPRSQLEAMPPFAPTQSPLFPPSNFYNSAVRHPVFFTETLRKPPFPIPDVASHGWNPVANGYILEQRKLEANGSPKTKL